MGDLAGSGRKGIVHYDQIIVSIEREVVRIKWALSLPWRADQFLSQRTGSHRQRGGKDCPPEKTTPVEARNRTESHKYCLKLSQDPNPARRERFRSARL